MMKPISGKVLLEEKTIVKTAQQILKAIIEITKLNYENNTTIVKCYIHLNEQYHSNTIFYYYKKLIYTNVSSIKLSKIWK